MRRNTLIAQTHLKNGLTAIAMFFFCASAFCTAVADDAVISVDSGAATTPEAAIEAAPDTVPADATLFDRWFDRFVDMHDTTSRHYIAMTHSIDNYLSGNTIENTSNGNYLKLEVSDTLYKGNYREDDISLKARFRLPNTEKHLQLIFTSSPQEEMTLEDRLQGNANGKRIHKESSVAGIEYTPDVSDSNWEQSYTAGIKLRFSGLIPVARYQIKKTWQLEDKWHSEFQQSFWYTDDKGAGATNDVNFYRPLNSIHTLGIGTEIEFKDYAEKNSQDIEYSDMHVYGLTIADYQRIDPTRGLQYRAGVLGESRPVNWITSYFIGATYRKALYKDWFLLAAGPQLSFPRKDNWKPQPSFTVLLQVYFSD